MGGRLAASLLICAIVTPACGGTVEGIVEDFGTGAPMEGAVVTAVRHGWGFSDGRLVWDKDRSRSVRTDERGRFRVGYRGSSVKLRAQSPGYQGFEAWYGPSDRPTLRLKRRVEVERVLPSGFLRLGIRTDGSPYGWDFSAREIAASDEQADILPVSVEPGERGNITFAAPGGVRFVPRHELGVDALFLVYSDRAPAEGYATTAVIDFESEGGVFFVRTRDERYAKFAFVPSAFSQTLSADVARDLSLHYVYNPDGSPSLLYQVPE